MTTAVQPARVEAPLWGPMVAAMGKTGGASIVSGLLGALGTKIVAAMLGPGSLALLATLQQLRDAALTAATANGKTALVQGASAFEGVERREFVRTVMLLFSGGTVAVAAVLLMAPAQVARSSRLPESSFALLAWVALTAALLSIFVFLTAILNALREIGKLAVLQVASPLVAALAAWPVAVAVRGRHPQALELLLAIPAAAAAGAAALALFSRRDQVSEWFLGAGRWWSVSAARGFLAISGAMLASGLAATTVLLAVRASITSHQGLAMTGQFDAAWNISMSQVTLLLGSIQVYYLPALAAARTAGERGRQIRHMLMASTLGAVPIIVGLACLKPLVIHMLYSAQFVSSPGFLRWTLAGDYLKISSWVLATPLLATREVGVFLGSDLAAHAVFFGSAMFLGRIVKPAEGAAIGFLLSYAVYFAFCCGYARVRHGFRFGVDGLLLWLTGLALVVGASAHCWSDSTVDPVKSAFWMVLAGAFSTGFALYLRRQAA